MSYFVTLFTIKVIQCAIILLLFFEETRIPLIGGVKVQLYQKNKSLM
jgi:hypothetical protein